MTNLLACSANHPDNVESVEKLQTSTEFEKTYEFYFN